MDFNRNTRRVHSINLTPLIDVMFFLVIFFMLSTSFVISESMELNLPSGGTGAGTPQDVLRVLVTPAGELEVDGTQYDMNRFDQLIRKTLAADEQQKILISSAPGVKVQQLVNALDVVYVNGGKNVQIDQYYEGATPDIGHDVKLER